MSTTADRVASRLAEEAMRAYHECREISPALLDAGLRDAVRFIQNLSAHKWPAAGAGVGGLEISAEACVILATLLGDAP